MFPSGAYEAEADSLATPVYGRMYGSTTQQSVNCTLHKTLQTINTNFTTIYVSLRGFLPFPDACFMSSRKALRTAFDHVGRNELSILFTVSFGLH